MIKVHTATLLFSIIWLIFGVLYSVLSEFTLSVHSVVLVKISHPEVVVGRDKPWIDGDGFLQVRNGIAGMLSPEQETRLVEFVDGFCGGS
jgi:hypothetical protein